MCAGVPAAVAEHGERVAQPGGAGRHDGDPPPLLNPLPHHHVQRAHAIQGCFS